MSQRDAKLSEIESEIAILESREETIIERAQRGGVVIARRHDASPASILGVRIVSGEKEAALKDRNLWR